MENKKEPLMSSEEWYYNQLSKQSGKILSNFEIGQQYAKYHTQWHLNNAKEFVADGVRHSETLEDDFMVWDELFGILAWKFKPTKSGDMFLDAEKVFQELKSKFELKKK